ncbi:UNVERIFIED_CONTAM: hypothetical protein FKN15_044550 [Acipenser sinensis]
MALHSTTLQTSRKRDPRLARRAYNNKPNSFNHLIALDTFLRSLQPLQLKHQVRLAGPRTLDEAVDRDLVIEAVLHDEEPPPYHPTEPAPGLIIALSSVARSGCPFASGQLVALTQKTHVFLSKLLIWGLPSGASSKGAPRGVQDALYSLDIANSSPGYSFADRGRELPGGGTQLAERCPGGGRARSSRVTAHQRPL